jgi:hypothetical protein
MKKNIIVPRTYTYPSGIIALLNQELNGQQMQKLGVPIIEYPQLNNSNDIDDFFKGKDALIIYFEIASANVGHRTCLLKKPGLYEFFDPYGIQIDSEFNYITKSKRVELNEQFNSLSRLLDDKRKQGFNIIHNTYKIQLFTFILDGVTVHSETCGKHTSARVVNRDKSLEQFVLDVYTKNHNLGPNDDVIICELYPNKLLQ